MSKRYKYGDVVEWSTARWMIVRWGHLYGPDPDPRHYVAVWIGPDKGSLNNVGDLMDIGVDYGPPYLVEDE